MQKKYLISFSFLSAALIASLLMLNTPVPKKETPTCCKKIEGECLPEIKNKTLPESSLENLSHQFIHLPVLFK